MFAPRKVGAASATLRVQTDAKQGNDTVTLSGTGVATATPVLEVSPGSVDFGDVLVGSESDRSTVTLSSTGTTAVSVVGTVVVGTGFARASSTCGVVLAPGGTCTENLFFAPTARGAASGLLTISDNAANSPQQVSLVGIGLAPAQLTIAPPNVDFGTTHVGSVSEPSIFTISNSGDVPTGPLTVSLSDAQFEAPPIPASAIRSTPGLAALSPSPMRQPKAALQAPP